MWYWGYFDYLDICSKSPPWFYCIIHSFLTYLPNNFVSQKVQEGMKETVTLDPVLTSKKGFVGDVYMVEIFQHSYEIKCSPCSSEDERKGLCHPRTCNNNNNLKNTFGHNRHVIEALGKQTSISSYKYNPKAIKRNTLNFTFNRETEKLNFVLYQLSAKASIYQHHFLWWVYVLKWHIQKMGEKNTNQGE